MSATAFKDLHIGFAKAWTEYSISDTELRQQRFEDVTEIMEVNKFLKGYTAQDLTNKKTGWRWVARLPLSLDMELMKKGVYKSKAAWSRWKNDPDNAIWALSRDIKLINKGKSK